VSAFVTVLAKECIDNLRDRRTLISTFSLALLGPIILVGLMSFILDRALGEQDDAIAFSLVGASHAPGLVDWLRQQNYDIRDIDLAADSDPRTLVTSGDNDVVLIIPADYADRFTEGLMTTLTIVYDSSELGSASRRANQLERALNSYSRTIGVLRLQLRGIDPQLLQPILVNELDVASSAERALAILSMVPYFILLVSFMGGFYLAIDTTTGEREHGSLEPLLSQPISRTSLVLGKIAATCVFAIASLMLLLLGFWVGLPLVPLERIGLALGVSFGSFMMIFLLMLPLIWLAGALLTVVASFAKTYKEAQTYLSFLIMVPTVPIIFAQLMGVEASLWMMPVPSLGQSLLIQDYLTNEPVSGTYLLASVLSTSILAAALTRIAIWIYNREQILG
jgi:sodium transport system permease protein